MPHINFPKYSTTYKALGTQTEDLSLGRGLEHTLLLHLSGLLASSSSGQ